MATTKPVQNDVSLPFAALQLLAPPVRLVSAALWKVMKQRDVMQYGVVEDFVTSACETVPGLLTARHQGKLALGLRGRLILELCSTQPDEQVIMPHLEKIRAPTALSSSSAAAVRRDVKIMRTVESFHSLVHALLADPTEREQFFKEEFPADYGPKFDQELEKLLWEFLIRLDQLLPVPSLAQTVSWLCDSPPVLEECARAATQPQLLDILLQHQTCLGHLEAAASIPPNMGDSILDSLSLPPSGRVPSDRPTGAKKSAVGPSDSTQTGDKTPFIAPVIGLISNEEVPIMTAAVKRRDDGAKEERKASKRSFGTKRKQPDKRDSESDDDDEEEEEEEEVLGMTRAGKKRISRSFRSGASGLGQGRGDQGTNESEEGGEQGVRKEECNRAVLETQLGVGTLRLPEDPSLRSIFVSCLSSQPRVIVETLSLTSGRAGKSSDKQKRQDRRRKSPVKAPTHKSTSNQPQKPDCDFPGLDDKENHPVLPSISSSPSLQRSNTETSALQGDSEDFVADSEDEATKNFKGRLFMKRYYKTKHGTYVPTLREFWKPGMTRRNLSSPAGKRR